MSVPADILDIVTAAGQSHLVAWWDELNPDEQAALSEQIRGIDFAELQSLAAASAHTQEDNSRAERATGPAALVRQPVSADDKAKWEAARKHGEELLAAGKVGAILVAGGQGTRLGFPHPKGMFPVGPVSENTLFQILCEQLVARSERAGKTIPYYIMTSDATHDETVAFFTDNQNFGLPAVHFFRQGNMPAVSRQPVDGIHRVLLAGKSKIATSPDGHGGILAALDSSGLLQQMAADGIEHLYYHQVDNPTAIVCDPAFIGFHALQNSDLSTRVVEKVTPEERMGVIVEVDGQTQIIEYSELTGDLCRRKDADGNWIFWAGNTAIHCFRRDFLQRLASKTNSLPFHLAKKNVPCLDDAGQLTTPDDPDNPNAIKFERFIFDALPSAQNALVVQGDRDREFNPVKNRSGADSPETSRAALIQIARQWLAECGHELDKDTIVEISPLAALDAGDLKNQTLDLAGDRIFLAKTNE